MELIDLKAQYRSIKNNIDQRISTVLQHGKFILGPEVYELESNLSNHTGVERVVSCANGTDALVLSLRALEIGPGDAVFCPTFSFFATAEAISLVGATPVFVDSEEASYNICSGDLVKKINQVKHEGVYTCRCIIAVDLFGEPADYHAIRKIADKNQLYLIEDGAQGFGGEAFGQKSCSFGDLSTTSFFPAKPLGCFGDGGAIFTNDNLLADQLVSLRQHGYEGSKYNNARIGMNSRLDTIQAAILLEKLRIFNQELARKSEIAKIYTERLSGHFRIPTIPNGVSSSWAQYTIQSDRRDLLIEFLTVKRIPSAVYYRRCIDQMPAYDHLVSRELNNARAYSDTVVSLPMHAYLSSQEVDYICECLLTFADKKQVVKPIE